MVNSLSFNMNTKKNMIVVILATLLLVISGCSSSSNDTKSSGISEGAFNGGSEALTFSFQEGTPPETIRDGGLQPFSIRLLVQNEGEYSIEQGEAAVSLTGFSSGDLNLDDSSQSLQAIRGVRKQGDNVIDGGRAQVTFSNMKYLPELPSGTHTQTLYANLCYPYKTKSLASLCITGDPLSGYDEDSSVCDVESSRDYANSGAPIKIENVEQYAGGQNSIEFKFDIVHSQEENSGTVYRRDSMDTSCNVGGSAPSSSDASLEENYVEFSVDAAPLRDISCNGGGKTGEVQLTDGSATVYCSVNTMGEEEYVKPVTVELDYDYLERISKDLTIEHIS